MDFLNKIGPGEMIPLLAIALGAIVGIVAIISGCLIANARVRHDAELRKNMLDRGMSAAEIEVAMRGFAATAAAQTSADEALSYDGELAKYLATPQEKNGIAYSPAAIDFILRAFRPLPANEKETIFAAIQGMIEEHAGEEQLIAAVRGLCRATDRPGEPKRPLTSSDMAADLPLEMRH